ncbi:hypothetical protein, partial [Nocardioides malaquae]|uniref:hypothetical protein n=1 Tax=Nocardioides malaquae TaxID=2773426 RepID=UPI001D0D64D1
ESLRNIAKRIFTKYCQAKQEKENLYGILTKESLRNINEKIFTKYCQENLYQMLTRESFSKYYQENLYEILLRESLRNIAKRSEASHAVGQAHLAKP